MNTLLIYKKITVRFSEVDSMGIVWHGTYAKYFEDGREAFGKEFGLGYMDILNAGYYAPLVELDFQYKKPIQYMQEIRVKIEYIPTDAAKIIYKYTILNDKDEVMTTGKSIQVFLDKEFQLVLFTPDFYQQWKQKYL